MKLKIELQKSMLKIKIKFSCQKLFKFKYPLLYSLFHGTKGTLIFNSSCHQIKIYIWEKNCQKGNAGWKKQGRLTHRSWYYSYTLESGHFIVKVVTTCFGIHYSNLNDFCASTCSHSLCRTSGGEDRRTWRPLDLQLRAALSLELFAGINMGAQGFLIFHVFLENECTQAKMTMLNAANTNTVSLNLSPFSLSSLPK